jgi:DNA-binding MarR family transcriptional regulator
METETAASEELERHLGYWMRRVSNRVSGAFARALQSRQTSVTEWVMLQHLRQRPRATPGELAESLSLTRGAVSKIVDKLEAKNWIASTTKREDQRVQLLSLTPRGRRVLPQLAEIAGRNDRQFFDCLDDGEKASLRRLLGKLSEFHQITDIPVE